MDSISNWEQNILANELNQGMEFAKKMKSDLSSTTSLSPETRDMLMQKILSSYDNALFILNWNESSSGQQAQKATTSRSESPISEDYRDLDAGLRNQHNQGDVSKKRKAFPTWKDQVRICSGNSIDGPTYDGCSWRKYGQKDILGAKYPRSYYRCTYRSTRDCWATKQVQRSDEEPSLLEITYKGKHTCNQANSSVLPPASPENEEQKCKNHQHNHTQQPPSDMLSNFRANLQVNTEEFDTKDVLNPFSFPSTFGCLTSGISFTAPVNDNMSGGYPPFISPATSGSSYLSVSPLKMNNVGQVQEAQDDDIISATTTTTNSPSPFANLDFSIDQVDFDPSFPFHTSDFF